MPISKEQISTLMSLITSSESDSLDCDGCFAQVSEFADIVLTNKEIPAALKSVENHLQQCMCCKDEFAALLDGLREMEKEQ